VRFFDRQANFLLGVLMGLVCCTAAPPPPAATTGAVSIPLRADAAAGAKIAEALRSVVQRMQQDGITAATAATRQAETYTTSLVRVDHTGSLQVVILVTTVDPQAESSLAQHQVRIEISDAELRLIQAWVPFDRLEQIAALPFVRYIRPPSYAVRR
jgi:hypothetical protein